MTSQTATPGNLVRDHWPVLAGLGFAALLMIDTSGGGLSGGPELAAVLAAAAAMYVGTAAIGKPSAAWPMFFATAVVITVVRLLRLPVDPSWVLVGGGVVLVAAGLVRGFVRPTYGVPLQSLGLIGFGAAAIAGTLLSPELGAYVVGVGLLGHAAWDVHHYRTERVVARTLAEFCLVLDAALGVALVLVTALT